MNFLVTQGMLLEKVLQQGILALIGGFFGTAVVDLTIDDPERVGTISAGVVGVAAGGLFGYRNFFQKIVIHLDE